MSENLDIFCKYPNRFEPPSGCWRNSSVSLEQLKRGSGPLTKWWQWSRRYGESSVDLFLKQRGWGNFVFFKIIFICKVNVSVFLSTLFKYFVTLSCVTFYFSLPLANLTHGRRSEMLYPPIMWRDKTRQSKSRYLPTFIAIKQIPPNIHDHEVDTSQHSWP